MSLYTTLGVLPDATPEEIKTAFRRAAMKNHPDRADGNHILMQAIQAAYDVLSDPERRQVYDETGSTARPPTRHKRAVDLLARMLDQIVAKMDDVETESPLLQARHEVNALRETGEEKQKELARQVTQRNKALKRLRQKEGEDRAMFHILDGLNARDKGVMEKNEDALKMLLVVLDILAQYDYEVSAPAPEKTVPDFSMFQDALAKSLAKYAKTLT